MTLMQLLGKSLFFVTLCAGLAASDSIQLRSGRRVEGKFIGGSATMVGFMSNAGIEYFPTSDVLVLLFENRESSMGALGPNPMKGKGAGTGRRIYLQRVSSSGAASKPAKEPPPSN
jgi:hypothetical protein